MADSTSNLDLISAAQASKEVTANELFNAGSPATLFARRNTTTTALTWGYYGGRFGGSSIANGTLTLTASATNYIVVHRGTLAVSVSTATTNWDDTGVYGRVYSVVTGASTVTSYQDHRAARGGILELPADNAAQVIAYAASITPDAAIGERVLVGVLTGNLTVNAPSNPRKGALLSFAFAQDATGGRTVTWNSVFKKPADGSGTANQKAMLSCIYDGAHWIAATGLSWL